MFCSIFDNLEHIFYPTLLSSVTRSRTSVVDKYIYSTKSFLSTRERERVTRPARSAYKHRPSLLSTFPNKTESRVRVWICQNRRTLAINAISSNRTNPHFFCPTWNTNIFREEIKWQKLTQKLLQTLALLTRLESRNRRRN